MVARLIATLATLALVALVPAQALAAAPTASECRALVEDGQFTGTQLQAKACFGNARSTFQTSGELDNLLQVVAQVVVDKAEQAGWTEVRQRLLDGGHCNDPKPLFPATCKVLRTSDIHDLLAQPSTLIQAAAQDLLVYLSSLPADPQLGPDPMVLSRALLPSSTNAFRTIATEWSTGGAQSVTTGFVRDLLTRASAAVPAGACPAGDSVSASLYVVGLCAIQMQSLSNITPCDFEPILTKCAPNDADRVRSIVQLTFVTLTSSGKARVDASIGTGFALADAAVAEGPLSPAQKVYAAGLLDSERQVTQGLVDSDWVRATSGAIDIFRRVLDNAPRNAAAAAEFSARRKVLAILAAAGQYASTMSSGGSASSAESARQQILKDLITRMVSRTTRASGLVLSLGGNLGLFGGARTVPTVGSQPAFPVQLGLGVGLQSYTKATVGFHAMLTVLDLGQYMTFSSSQLTVQTPDGAAVLIFGGTMGLWCLSRETPFYIGPFGSVSPFVKSTSGQASYEVGLAMGVYVPLLDFN